MLHRVVFKMGGLRHLCWKYGHFQMGLAICLIKLQYLDAMNAPALEYCAGDTFSPSCQQGEILMVHHALYGRMKIGRCVSIDLGNIGCTSDALAWMDRECSGKMTCEVRVPNHELKEKLKCSLAVDITPYLEVSSSCVQVMRARSQCNSPYHVSASGKKQVLSSDVTLHTECGSEAAPWVIQAKTGQQINISVIDFFWNDEYEYKRMDACPVEYGYIVDGETSDMLTICGGATRIKHLLVSKGDMIQVVLKQEVVEEYRFLLEYSVVGCEDLKPPRGSWTKRHKDTLTIGCHDGGNLWTVTCNGTKWLGHYGSCERDFNVQAVEAKEQSTNSDVPRVVLLSLICGVTAVLCCVAITTILAYFCIRKQKQLMKNEQYYTQTLPLKPQGTLDLNQFRTMQSMYRPTTLTHHRTGSSSQTEWNSVPVRLPQNLMMTSMTSSMGASDTIYDVVPNQEESHTQHNLM